MKLSTNSEYINKITILFVFLFFNFTVYFSYNSSLHILTDAAYYLMGADNLANGNGFTSYNVGYLNEMKTQDFKELIPITRYQPLYSVCIAAVKKLGFETLPASRYVNFFFLGIFLLTWVNLFNKIFTNKYFSALANLFLIFSAGIFTYYLPPHTEMFFLAQLGILGNLIFYWNQIPENQTIKKYSISILISLVLIAIVLTRYAGIGFIIGFFVASFFIFQNTKPSDKLKHILMIGILFAIGFSFWAFRNIEIMGSITDKYPNNYHGTLFDFERIFQVINLFLTFSLGLPSFIEKFSFILLFPIFLILSYIIYNKKFCSNPINYWFLITIFVYISMVIYMAIGNRAVDRINGFQRFFALTQPFLIGILLFMLQILNQLSKNIFGNLSKVFIIGLVAVSLLSGINRTRIYFQTLPAKEINQNIYTIIKQNATKNDLILSNEWQNVSAKTSLPIVQLHYRHEIDSLKLYYKGKYSNTYLVLLKDVGITYRKGVDTWTEILKDRNFEIIDEKPEAIFVKLN